jgi:16S rRNA (uracil1498-N3)-methyltransferase
MWPKRSSCDAPCPGAEPGRHPTPAPLVHTAGPRQIASHTMSARLFVDTPLHPGLDLSLPAGAARHVQVLRMQPGEELTAFNGQGGEWRVRITRMGRSDVQVMVEQFVAVDRELAVNVTLVAGMPANDRFDWLIEKATELGAAEIVPMMCERSVLRLSGERAQKKREHWQGIAISAAQQCGRTHVPHIAAVHSLADVCAGESGSDNVTRLLLSLADAQPLGDRLAGRVDPGAPLRIFSGPEGGLTDTEERLLGRCGALPTSLGARVLRSETAPLAVLSYLALGTATR